MSDSEYSEKFDEDHEGGDNTSTLKKSLDVNETAQPQGGAEIAEELHHIRLSIHLHSIRRFQSRALAYAAYNINEIFPAGPFRTHPPIALTSKEHEFSLENGFGSYEKALSKSQLSSTFSSKNLKIDLFHHDRKTADSKIGQIVIPFDDLLTAKVVKTAQSVAKVFDSWLPIDGYDAVHGAVTDKVGEIRVITYLEDLGATTGLTRNVLHSQGTFGQMNMNIGSGDATLFAAGTTSTEGNSNFGGQGQNTGQFSVLPANINLRPQDGGNPNPTKDVTNVAANAQANTPEYQVVWELELWKNAEEAKFKAYLKEKEQEHLANVCDGWRERERQREHAFTTAMDNLAQLESKTRQKLNELNKREAKINALEAELIQSISETNRKIEFKEEESQTVRRQAREDKLKLESENRKAQDQISQLKKVIEDLDENFRLYKKDAEDSPVSILKQELHTKNMEVMECERKMEIMAQDKSVMKLQLEKVKSEYVKLKKAFDEQKENFHRQQMAEYEKLKLELRTKQEIEAEKLNLNSIRFQLDSLQGNTLRPLTGGSNIAPDFGIVGTSAIHGDQKENVRPSTTNLATGDNQGQQSEKPRSDQIGGGVTSTTAGATPVYMGQYDRPDLKVPVAEKKTRPADANTLSEIKRIEREKFDLLQTGLYNPSDALIIELDNKLNELKSQ